MTEEEAEMLGHAAAMDSLRDHYQAPKHAEPDLTEAMEVWLRAKRAWDDPDSGIGRAPNQAATRVIATALEARDAWIAELEGALDNIAADHPMIFPPDGPPRTPTDAEGWEYCKRQARTILTKQEPKS